jgi:hypothetical protein
MSRLCGIPTQVKTPAEVIRAVKNTSTKHHRVCIEPWYCLVIHQVCLVTSFTSPWPRDVAGGQRNGRGIDREASPLEASGIKHCLRSHVYGEMQPTCLQLHEDVRVESGSSFSSKYRDYGGVGRWTVSVPSRVRRLESCHCH